MAGSGPYAPAVSWEPELDELRRRRELAAEMGGEERVARQHTSGRLTVRERIDRLFDDGSFREVGAIAGEASYEDGEVTGFLPANTVVGEGRIEGRRAVVQGDDFTVRGGAADAAIWEKMAYAERLAGELRTPLVRLVDGTGGGGSVKSLEDMGHTYVPFLPGFEHAVSNLSTVPVVAAALGPVAGLGAARVVASHFAVIVRGTAQLFVAGPPVVAAAMGEAPDKEELGGRAPRPRRARSMPRPPTRKTPRPDPPFPVLPAVQRARAAAGHREPTTPPTAARRSSSRWFPAIAASPTRCASCSTPCSTVARASSWAPGTAGR